MKLRLSVLLLSLVNLIPAAPNPSLQSVQTIYLLPMGGGLDQFLANRLTKGGRFQVVTDPQQADAIFTDRIGAALEMRLKDLYPPAPKPAEPEEKSEESSKDKDKEKAKDKDNDASEMFIHEAAPARISSFGRGKGNVFLVDRNTRRVLWSDYKLPKNSRPQELNRIADSIVDRLQDEVKNLTKAAAKTP